MKRVVILGGGFAGMETAVKLQKSGRFKVTLVSDRDYLYLYPISIWIPIKTITPDKARISFSKITKKYPFVFIVDSVKSINAEAKTIECNKQSIEYDYLVIAAGAEKMKHIGIENTLSICGKPEVALSIRDNLDRLIERGEGKISVGFGANPKDSSAVRGGPAFELMFNINHILRKKKLRDNFELTFFAPMDQPGAKMGANSVEMVGKMFDQYKIKKRYGKKISYFERDGVIFEDGSKLESDLILFIPASSGHSIAQTSGLPVSEAGFIKIDDYGRVAGYKDIYAIGDIAALEGPDWTAKQGHIAELMGRNAAHNILVQDSGSGTMKGYKDLINIICVMDTGNGAAFVYRNRKKSFIIPMPLAGHWVKMAWGLYARLTKQGLIPRIPGL